MADDSTNSMCFVYAQLIETELRSDNPDMEQVFELLGYIKRYCQTVATPPGETPPQLEEHLIEEGSREAGTVVHEGREIPRSALALAEETDDDQVSDT